MSHIRHASNGWCRCLALVPRLDKRQPSCGTISTGGNPSLRVPSRHLFYPTPHHIYRAVVLAAMIYLAAQVCWRLDVADSETLDSVYDEGQRIALHSGFTAYILSEGSFPNHWRRVRDEVQARAGGSGHPPSNFSLMKKFWCMLDIAHSVRMVGWIQEPRDCLPPPPPPSRRTFLWKTLLKLIANIIALDLLTLMLAQNPAFDSCVTTHRRPRDLPRRGFPSASRASRSGICPFPCRQIGCSAQCCGLNMRWPWPLEPHPVAEHLGALGRCVHASQLWGYVSLNFLLSSIRHLSGGHGIR